MLKPVVEGWTEPIVHRLLNDKVPVLIQGMDVALILIGHDGTAVDTTGKVANEDDGTEPNRGRVAYRPDAGDLVAAKSMYSVRWRVTDGDGKNAFWPNDDFEKLKVSKPGWA